VDALGVRRDQGRRRGPKRDDGGRAVDAPASRHLAAGTGDHPRARQPARLVLVAVHVRHLRRDAASAVRRQVRADGDAHSLGRLLLELSEDPKPITRAFWIGLRTRPDDPFLTTLAERGWDEHWARDVGTHLDPAIPPRTWHRCAPNAAPSSTGSTGTSPHSDRRPIPADKLPTLDNVHDAIEQIGEVYNRYYTMLTNASWAMVAPTIQHDWKASFRVPWIKPEHPGPSEHPRPSSGLPPE
jgi:hypothetical protein